jgi:C1A family cysteine protease
MLHTKGISGSHPLSKSKEMAKLFSLFMKLNKKKYKSLSEYDYRLKIFKENLFQFIQKGDKITDRVIIKKYPDGKMRLIIIPDKRLNVDFYEAEGHATASNENSVKFEINKFSDMSEEEYDNMFSLDQSFFDETKNPPYIHPDYQDNKPEYKDIKNYLKILQKEKPDEDISKKFPSSSEEEIINNSTTSSTNTATPEHLVNVTPHFSTHPDHKSIWELAQPKDKHISSSDGVHTDFFFHSRILQNHIQLPYTSTSISIDGNKLPMEINWRDLDAIGPVKDQIKCNACYAFAAIGALEGRYRIKTGKNISLSEQEIVDCSKTNDGCVGGLPQKVFDYIQTENINYTHDYPFDGKKDSICRKKKINEFDGSIVKSYTNLPLGVLALLKNLVTGPIAVISYASKPFRNYAGGIYNGEGCKWKYKANHSSTLIGYNLRRPDRYLYFKNGWGTDWGELGYYKVRIDSLSKYDKSHCLIAAQRYNSIPLLE